MKKKRAQIVPVFACNLSSIPMATVIIPALLRKLTGGQDRVSAVGATLRDIIDDLERQFPDLRTHLIDGDELQSSLAVAIDGEITAGSLQDLVLPQSEVHFVPAVAGGSGHFICVQG